MQKTKFIWYVEIATIVYLAIPSFIFMLGFLNLFWAVATSASLLFAVYCYFKNTATIMPITDSEIMPHHPTISYKMIMGCIIFALLFALTTGAGGWGSQVPDWAKHTAMLSHITSQSWPVVLELDKGDFLLTYYIAYYLVPAVFGKIFDFEIANQVIALSSFIAIFLTLCWILIFSKRLRWWILPCFFLFSSGLDFLLYSQNSNLETKFIEYLPSYRSVLANISSIVAIPPHAFAGWLLFFLCLKNIVTQQSRQNIGLIVTIGMLWSILSTFGICMFMLVYWMCCWVRDNRLLLYKIWQEKFSIDAIKAIIKCYFSWLMPFFSIQNIVVILPCIIIMLYFQSSGSADNKILVPDIRNIFRGFFWPYLLVDFLFLWLVLFFINHKNKKYGYDFLKGDFYVLYCVAIIFIFITYNYSSHNLQRNSNYSGTMILFLATMRSFDCFIYMKKSKNAYLMVIWIFLLLLSLATPLQMLYKVADVAVARIAENGTSYRKVDPIFIEIADTHPRLHITTPLLIGELDKPFYRYLARKTKSTDE